MLSRMLLLAKRFYCFFYGHNWEEQEKQFNWFVSSKGSVDNDGRTPETACRTIDQAFKAVEKNSDTIQRVCKWCGVVKWLPIEKKIIVMPGEHDIVLGD